MVKNIGIYALVFFLVYTIGAIVFSLLGEGLNILREYIDLRRKGYTEEHEEIKSRENIYHSRLVGKPRVKRSLSEDARELLEEVTQKKSDTAIEEDAVIEEDDEEEILPNYMIERVEPPEEICKEPKEDGSSTGVLEESSTGLLAEDDSSTGLLEARHPEGDKGTGLLEREEGGTGLLSEARQDDTGLLERKDTGLLERDDQTGLLQENKDATGILSRESTGLLKEDINIDVFKGN